MTAKRMFLLSSRRCGKDKDCAGWRPADERDQREVLYDSCSVLPFGLKGEIAMAVS